MAVLNKDLLSAISKKARHERELQQKSGKWLHHELVETFFEDFNKTEEAKRARDLT